MSDCSTRRNKNLKGSTNLSIHFLPIEESGVNSSVNISLKSYLLLSLLVDSRFESPDQLRSFEDLSLGRCFIFRPGKWLAPVYRRRRTMSRLLKNFHPVRVRPEALPLHVSQSQLGRFR